jgi:hypothetical protein
MLMNSLLRRLSRPLRRRIFEHGNAAQPFQAHGFGDEAHVAGLEAFTLAAPAQAIGDELREHPEALIQGIAHGGAGGLRQNRSAHQGGADNSQGDFQYSPNGRHKGAIRMGQRR